MSGSFGRRVEGVRFGAGEGGFDADEEGDEDAQNHASLIEEGRCSTY